MGKTGKTYTTNENGIGYSVVELSTENIFEVPASLPITATDETTGKTVSSEDMKVVKNVFTNVKDKWN
ncbi:hypothetical protein [Enterococcus casseliflavus]|uniref:hypothetical protein n=1 Tax=Enterococcus casseliflavus TaxID=37734 RepID=UPI0022DF8AE8|nr:hypothetical protein [Enterococcus casseliflavus]